MWLRVFILAGLAHLLLGGGVAWAQCANIAGQWEGTETVTITCRALGESETVTETGSGPLTMQQSGCNISYAISSPVAQINFTRTGTIAGNTIRLTGPFVVFVPGVSVTENNATIVGTVENSRRISLSGTGVASGSFEGISFSCDGTSTAVLTRDLPDLIVTAAAVSNTAPRTDQSFTVSATVRNQGNASAGATTLRYFRSPDSTITTGDTQIATDAVAGLSQNGTSPESATVSIDTTGTFWVGACVDSVSGETPTTNNCSTGVQVTVKPRSKAMPWLNLLLLDD